MLYHAQHIDYQLRWSKIKATVKVYTCGLDTGKTITVWIMKLGILITSFEEKSCISVFVEDASITGSKSYWYSKNLQLAHD